MRSYILHVPPKYDGKTRLPLVIDMHGKGGTGQGQMGSGWLAKADAVGIVMMYPDGLYNSWNGGPAGCPTLVCCCQPAQDQNIDDAGFLRAAVAKTAQDGCIDLKRVYATGLSNGGIMSHWLACDAADMFAAIAPASGPNMIDCKPSRPVTVVNYRGRQDTLVLYNGGASMAGGHVWPSAMADFTKWSDLDKCTDDSGAHAHASALSDPQQVRGRRRGHLVLAQRRSCHLRRGRRRQGCRSGCGLGGLPAPHAALMVRGPPKTGAAARCSPLCLVLFELAVGGARGGRVPPVRTTGGTTGGLSGGERRPPPALPHPLSPFDA